MQSSATTVDDYLAEQPGVRRAVLEVLLQTVRESIKPGFDETMRWGMISFEVPMALSGPTYNSEPLNYVAIAAQKNYFSVYLIGAYMNPDIETEFRERWAKSGLKLDMGKACVRFKDLSKADLPTIAWASGLLSPDQYLSQYQSARPNRI